MRRPGKRSKFGVRIDAKGAAERTCEGYVFASKAERVRYQELRLLERAGEIRELELQPKFPLMAPTSGRVGVQERIGEYRADFRYRSGPTGVLVIEDVKGVRTEMYRWKKRHVEIQYGITVTEISRR